MRRRRDDDDDIVSATIAELAFLFIFGIFLYFLFSPSPVENDEGRWRLEVHRANLRADDSEQRAGAAEQRAGDAQQRANAAERRAGDAEQRADDAEQRADAAEQRAGDAEQRADAAEQRAGDAEQRADDAEQRANAAGKSVGEAEQRADAAEKRAGDAERRAGQLEAELTEQRGRAEKAEEARQVANAKILKSLEGIRSEVQRLASLNARCPCEFMVDDDFDNSSDLSLSIDCSGSEAQPLFPQGSDELNETGKACFVELCPRIMLFAFENSNFGDQRGRAIETLSVEGHTSSEWGKNTGTCQDAVECNLDLSSRRARAVYSECRKRTYLKDGNGDMIFADELINVYENAGVRSGPRPSIRKTPSRRQKELWTAFFNDVVAVEGLGSRRPILPNHPKDPVNRRVEFRLSTTGRR